MILIGTGKPKNYVGTSDETKPVDVPGGTLFTETDTPALYVFDKKVWRRVDQSYTVALVLERLENIAQRQEDALERIQEQLAAITGIDLSPHESLR